jgi:hypothetical protein
MSCFEDRWGQSQSCDGWRTNIWLGTTRSDWFGCIWGWETRSRPV